MNCRPNNGGIAHLSNASFHSSAYLAQDDSGRLTLGGDTVRGFRKGVVFLEQGIKRENIPQQAERICCQKLSGLIKEVGEKLKITGTISNKSVFRTETHDL